jgi:hypothetical protein
MGKEYDLDRKCRCETICGAVYRSAEVLPRITSHLFKEQARHLTYNESTIGEYDFAIAHRHETMIVKDCHGSQHDIRQTSTACGRGYVV